jgi:hypothetical protein
MAKMIDLVDVAPQISIARRLAARGRRNLLRATYNLTDCPNFTSIGAMPNSDIPLQRGRRIGPKILGAGKLAHDQTVHAISVA